MEGEKSKYGEREEMKRIILLECIFFLMIELRERQDRPEK